MSAPTPFKLQANGAQYVCDLINALWVKKTVTPQNLHENDVNIFMQYVLAELTCLRTNAKRLALQNVSDLQKIVLTLGRERSMSHEQIIEVLRMDFPHASDEAISLTLCSLPPNSGWD
jgi:hypothetical protein